MAPAAARPLAEVVTELRAAGCVFAEEEAALLVQAAGSAGELSALVARRASGVPLEYVLGWAGFCGLRVAVDPGVFIPRRRSEFLVDRALALNPPGCGAVVVDLCCGSGALGAAVASRRGGVALHAADLDPAAVRCARRNVEPMGGRVHHGDLYQALPTTLRGRVDLLLANVPYVPTGALPLLPAEAREHESPLALAGGPDGLAVLRRVAGDARAWLAPGGHVLMEISDRQAAAAVAALREGGLDARVARRPRTEATIVVGARPAPPPGPCRPERRVRASGDVHGY